MGNRIDDPFKPGELWIFRDTFERSIITKKLEFPKKSGYRIFCTIFRRFYYSVV